MTEKETWESFKKREDLKNWRGFVANLMAHEWGFFEYNGSFYLDGAGERFYKVTPTDDDIWWGNVRQFEVSDPRSN